MALSGPNAIDDAIAAGVDLDGSPLPEPMLALYREVMDKENARPRSGVTKSMRNRIVRSGAKHYARADLDARLKDAGWEGLKAKEVAFFYAD